MSYSSVFLWLFSFRSDSLLCALTSLISQLGVVEFLQILLGRIEGQLLSPLDTGWRPETHYFPGYFFLRACPGFYL